MAKVKVYCAFLMFTEQHVDSAMDVLRPLVQRIFPRQIVYYQWIDNSRVGGLPEGRSAEIELIGGDNFNREFSGWDVGLKRLEERFELNDSDIFILANDTFHRSYGTEYLNFFDSKEVRYFLNQGRLIGYVDAYPKAVELFGVTLLRWIRSSLVFARWGELKRLRPLALEVTDDEIFSKDWQEFFKSPSKLSRNYRDYLKTWLFGDFVENSEFKEAWHSQKALTPESFESLKGKTRAILCEHYLSGRAQALGISTYDVRNREKLPFFARLLP